MIARCDRRCGIRYENAAAIEMQELIKAILKFEIMAMPAFDAQVLKDRLSALDLEKKITFGVLCCERLLPKYLAFQQDSGWGDAAHVRNALDCAENFALGQRPSLQEIKTASAACESAASNSDDFSSIYVTAAQDACFSICSLLDCLIEEDVNKIVRAAIYATESVDLYVQEIEAMDPADPQLEKRILMHHLMQRELQQQEKDLVAMESVDALSLIFLEERKSSWSNEGKGNLDSQ